MKHKHGLNPDALYHTGECQAPGLKNAFFSSRRAIRASHRLPASGTAVLTMEMHSVTAEKTSRPLLKCIKFANEDF
jgi:hypothetical protein